MTWLVQPRLINDPFGDAGLYLDFRFGKRALLFDLGDLHPLPPWKLLRVSNVFVSHAHMDHFCGFDRLLGVCLGRPRRLELFGPPGFIDRVQHKLAAYSWNLIAGNAIDFVIGVAEMHGDRLAVAAEFHTRDAFRRQALPPPVAGNGILVDEVEFRVRAVTLDHGIPCLAFAFEEKPRINVWKDRLRRLGLPVGPWLTDLKQAVRRGEPDETLFTVPSVAAGEPPEVRVSLGQLKADVLHIVPGERIVYVVDAVYHANNAARIIALASDADQFFIESPFLEEDAAIAARKLHLTAAQAGSLARRAGVKRVVPLHFSPRYLDRPEQIRQEIDAAFAGAIPREKDARLIVNGTR
jgi:ribonuclease Z